MLLARSCGEEALSAYDLATLVSTSDSPTLGESLSCPEASLTLVKGLESDVTLKLYLATKTVGPLTDPGELANDNGFVLLENDLSQASSTVRCTLH